MLPVALGGAIYRALTRTNYKVLGLSLGATFDSRIMDFSNALNPLRVGQGLTVKQEAFAQARHEGKSSHDAYMEAFKPEGWKRDAVNAAAWHLDHNDKVLARVAQLRAERMKDSSLLQFLSPEFITDGIMRIAMTGEKESVQLQAYALLGKMAGIDLFRETTRVERVDRTAEDVDRELKAKLQSLMAGMTIDATPNPSSPDPVKPQPNAKRDRRRKPTPA